MAGRWLVRIGLPLFMCLCFTGCGYHFAGEGSGPKPGMQKIAIPLFENKTSEAELETLFASALRHQFLLRGPFQIVSSKEAEAVFRGRVIRIETLDIAHRGVDSTLETRLLISVDVRCIDTKSGAVLWQDNNMVQYGNYLQDASAITAYENRRRAEAIIARKIAERIHDRFLSNF
ncbi:MAG TPA: hypothetical protein DEO88_13855 [Syntrophobacteraceae bacterium]|nr:hypothetical protein [Syntrophobacteraceae bacterium]